MFEWSEEEGRYMSAHHPFTLPQAETEHELEGDLSKVRAIAYDIVLNGYELGGGSLRINHKDLQERMFKALGFTKEAANEQFVLVGSNGLRFPTTWRIGDWLGPLRNASCR